MHLGHPLTFLNKISNKQNRKNKKPYQTNTSIVIGYIHVYML